MTNEELAQLIITRTEALEKTFQARLAITEEGHDRGLAALASHVFQRLTSMEERIEAKITSAGGRTYGAFITMESDLLDVRGDLNKLRGIVEDLTRRLDART